MAQPHTVGRCTLDAIFVGEPRPRLKRIFFLAGVIFIQEPTLTN